MITRLKDLNKLKKPLIFLMVVLVSTVLLVYAAYQFYETQRQATQMQESLLNRARAQLQQYDEEKNLRATFLPRYQTMIENGFIGEGRRQVWIDTLMDIQKNHHLFEIQYEIGRLASANTNFLPPAAPFTLYQSDMKISFALLHEGDLLTLTNALKEKNLSPYLIKSCEMSELESKANATNYRAQTPALTATCEISWYTLAEPNAIPASTAP